MNYELQGKVAIVTGARTGIGQAAAISLARSGAHIVGVGHNEMPETRAQVEAFGVRFLEVLEDLTKPSAEMFDRIVGAAVKEFGHVDILINNAGIILREDAIDYSEEYWDRVMDINIKTVFFLSQRVAKEFVAQGTGGKIVSVASLLSFQGGIRVPAYAASKSGVTAVTKAMANEWAKLGINVNAVAPGYVITNNTKALQADEKRYNEILGRIPAGRWADAADLGEPIAFLCSEGARYIHGATLAVDGGWLAR